MSMFLHSSTETAFLSNGLGSLRDAIDAEVYEELNGQFELTMRYPVSGFLFSKISTDCYITAKPNPVSKPQPFRIYRITKPMGGIVTVYGRHMAYNMGKIIAQPFIPTDAKGAMQLIKEKAVPECPFTFQTDLDKEGIMLVMRPTDLWTILGSSEGAVLDVYGGEYEFDGYAVMLHQRRGADRGVSVRYGKNLRSLEQDENVANVYTGVYPFWAKDDVFVQLPELYVSAEGNYPEQKLLPLDLSDQFEEAPTEDDLRAAASAYILTHDVGKPEISLTVDFVPLEQTEDYKGMEDVQQVLLGDTVGVYFPQLGVETSARAVATRYSPILGRYKNVTLGTVKPTVASTVAQTKSGLERLEMSRSSGTGNASKTRQIVDAEGRVVSADGSIVLDLQNNEITLDGRKLGWLNQGGYSYLVGLDG